MSADDKAIRKCLGPDCGKMFMSEWAGNRLCYNCKRNMENIHVKEIFTIAVINGKDKL